MSLPAKSYDAAVIGAGPAGGSAALALARNGYSVVLLDKAALPRYKTCGGGVLARAYKLLPPNAAQVVERSFHSVALNFLGTGLNFTVTRTQPVVYMAMRADLDHLLAREAEAAGVQLIQSCAVRHLTQHSDSVEIITSHGTFRAQFVIGADGIYSPTAKAAGWPELSTLAPALEHEIYLSDEDFARFSALPRFDFNTIDAGYAWVFPKRDHLSVGILSTHRRCSNLPAKLAEYLQTIGIRRIQKTEKHGYLIPLRPRQGPLARGRILLAGDAAGLVDPITAEGITHACLSGQLAAAALTEVRLDAAQAASTYQALLEKHILGELRAARMLARVLYHHPRLRNAAFRLNGQKLCDFVTQVIMGERGYRDALRRPASYFKLFGIGGEIREL